MSNRPAWPDDDNWWFVAAALTLMLVVDVAVFYLVYNLGVSYTWLARSS